jgi:hypothetical protein
VEGSREDGNEILTMSIELISNYGNETWDSKCIKYWEALE